MIVFLEGLLVEKQPNYLVMNVAGVGYHVNIPLSTFEQLPDLLRPLKILVYDCIREDDHQLFGFATEAERKMFLLLMTVSGIGPRMSLSVLSGLSIRDLVQAIKARDVKKLSSISGVGKKTAERILVELKDKIGTDDFGNAMPEKTILGALDEKAREAILALIALGYRKNEAEAMVEKVYDPESSSETVESILRKALAR